MNCLRWINAQKHVTVIHKLIANLPEKEAHNVLWQSWRDVRDTCEMFVKVDADTCLADEMTLSNLWFLMSSNPRHTGIQAPLMDHFTDGLINGLNCFRPSVTFNDTTNELYCDRQVDTGHDIVIKSSEVSPELIPAGYHCFHATPVQSFHFGLHRALKNQVDTIVKVKNAFKNDRDHNRGLALIGASVCENFRHGGFNYSDERFVVAADAAIKNYDRLIEGLT